MQPFLTAKASHLNAGEITKRTFDENHKTAKMLIEAFGKLGLADFEAFGAELAKRNCPVRLAKYIQLTRFVFKYQYENDHITIPVKFGPEFIRPSKKVIRKLKPSKPPKLFDARELRMFLDHAPVPMRAMILLGANAHSGLAIYPLCRSLPFRTALSTFRDPRQVFDEKPRFEPSP